MRVVVKFFALLWCLLSTYANEGEQSRVSPVLLPTWQPVSLYTVSVVAMKIARDRANNAALVDS